jgi:uncharacterized protein with HEPN domain
MGVLNIESRDSILLTDILEYAVSATEHLGADSLEGYLSNDVLQGDINYRTMIVGEALHSLSDEFKQKHPELPYIQAYHMRNILTHVYGKVDPTIVFQTVKEDFPGLIKDIKAISESQPNA